MVLLSWTLVIFASFALTGNEEFDSDQFLSTMNRALEGAQTLQTKRPNSCNAGSVGPNLTLKALHNKIPKEDYFCKVEPTVDRFCRQVDQLCSDETGSSSCHNVINADLSKKRLASPELMGKIYMTAANSFYGALDNPDIHSICCRGDKVCTKKFKETKLVIIKSDDPLDQTANYLAPGYGGPAIRISDVILANYLDSSSISSVILHELGHACQYSRNTGAASLALHLADYCLSTKTTQADMMAVFPETKASCLMGVINSPKNTTTCKGLSAMEVFAESIFMQFRQDLPALARSCSSYDDLSHIDPRKYLHCFVETKEFQEKMCEKEEPL